MRLVDLLWPYLLLIIGWLAGRLQGAEFRTFLRFKWRRYIAREPLTGERWESSLRRRYTDRVGQLHRLKR